MRIKYIDVLKAFPIIAVVLYHTGLMTYGYLGVDLFLVVAGCLTTKSISTKMEMQNGLIGGGKFGRIVKLLPPLLVAGFFACYWASL